MGVAKEAAALILYCRWVGQINLFRISLWTLCPQVGEEKISAGYLTGKERINKRSACFDF